jgi:hypothetical protein
MSELDELLSELKSGLLTLANERTLIELIDSRLCRLRVLYRTQRAEFLATEVEFLRSLNGVQAELRTFVDLLEEKDDIRTREDAEEFAACLTGVKQHLEPHLVAQRAAKELREVIARSRDLPSAARMSRDAQYRLLCREFEANAEACRKCGHRMVLRQQDSDPFWGCSQFPRCFNKRKLSARETQLLFP